MPEWSVRRRFPRYLVHLPLLYEANPPAVGRAEVGWTIELSEGGACVELDRRLPAETPLRLSLQTDTGRIEVEGRVVWAGKPDLPGGVCHGVAFSRVSPEDLRALRDLLQSPGLGRRAGVRVHVQLPVTCRRLGHAGPSLQGQTADVSREGLLLLLPDVLPPGTAVEVIVHTSLEPLKLEGKIVWADPMEIWAPGEPIAHGMRVTALHGSLPSALGILLTSPPAGPPTARR